MAVANQFNDWSRPPNFREHWVTQWVSNPLRSRFFVTANSHPSDVEFSGFLGAIPDVAE